MCILGDIYTFMRLVVSNTLFFSLLLLIGCGSDPVSKIPLIQKDSTKKLERENTLFVFVGEKISVKDLPAEHSEMDAAYLATYKVMQRVYGSFDSDTIVFRVFSHKGFPQFAEFSHVLLYVSKAENYYYHEKYQFDAVYKAKNGRWASYSSEQDNMISQDSTVREEKIKFPGLEAYGNYVEDLFLLKKNGVLTYRGLFGDTIPVIPPVKMEFVIDTSGVR
jgi:hypothetical protein